MSPRKYRMGRRAESVARTRARIVEAAMELYRDHDVAGTSMQEIARNADVAPGTVLNHFADSDALASAVVDELVRRLRVPSAEIFDGARTVEARLRALAHALADFFERAAPWFDVHARESGRVAAFTEGARDFDARVDALVRSALEQEGDADPVDEADPRRGVVRTLLGPHVFRDLRFHQGLTTTEAAELATEVLLAWLAAAPEPRTSNREGS